MESLKNLIICPVCQTLHKRRPIKRDEEARCIKCDTLLYKNIDGIEYKIFAFAISAFIFFFLANIFNLISINLSGFTGSFTLIEAILDLFNQGYVLVSLFALLVLEVYPFFVLLFSFLFALFMIVGFKRSAKKVLTGLELVSRWSMLDIFFIAILVAMVKIFEYASIEFDIAFWALFLVVVYEFYITKIVKIESLWDYWESR